jgi:LPS-assembly protein
MLSKLRCVALFFYLVMFVVPALSGAAFAQSVDQQPVDLTADSLSHDEDSQIITATGNVELIQGRRILRADQIRYDLQNDKAMATGNVVLTEANGDVFFAEEVELENEMQKGFVTGFQAYLAEGGRFTAKEGERQRAGRLIVMKDATYTPCECDESANGSPAWQIRASEMSHDLDTNHISYKNARFELFGVPLLYTPYMSHPDGKVKRKSGLLTPQVAFDSELGLTVIENYYIDLAPHKDMTVGAMLTSEELPVLLGQYRHRFNDASLTVEGSTTYSGYTDSVAGEDIETEDKFRGHVKADALWNINNKWRAGANVNLTTDDQYLRQYDFASDDVLENELYVERFSGRDYAVARALAFQDIRIREEQTDQPNILPEVEASFLGEPGGVLGGRWQVDLSALGLQRDSGQDVTRAIAEANWQNRVVTNFGLVNTLDLSVRGDMYRSNDRDVATAGSGRSKDGTEVRTFTQAHLVSALPMVKPLRKSQIVVQPMAALTLAPDVDEADDDIPNEDSQDVQLDASNLFNESRFPGMDRIEDRSRVTYGVQTGVYGYEGSELTAFLGQSHRFDESGNPFPKGSGLSRQDSDFVGQISGRYKDRYGADYRMQLGSDDFSSRRHELDAYANWDRLDVAMRYLFAKALEGTDISDSREQIEGAAGLFVTDKWRLRGGALYDLGVDPGLRQAEIGIDYFGCCLSFSIGAERNLTTDASGDSGTEIMFRLGLKGLGEFETNEKGRWQADNL